VRLESVRGIDPHDRGCRSGTGEGDTMSFGDTLKGLLGKGKQLAAENADKVEDAVDKAGDFVDGKTGGKYKDTVDKVQDAAKKAIPPKQ
jgi:hypothetical protein